MTVPHSFYRYFHLKNHDTFIKYIQYKYVKESILQLINQSRFDANTLVFV